MPPLPRAAAVILVAFLAGCAGPAGESGAGAPGGDGPVDGSDPLFATLWHLPLGRVPEAWAVATGRNVTIGIIDTGIQVDHPEFADKLVLLEGAVLAGDRMEDVADHGTGVAGVAAARAGNGRGVAGVAPDARILPVRVMTFGTVNEFEDAAFFDRVARGVRFAADNGAHVISLSFSLTKTGGTLQATAPDIYAALDHAWSKGAVLVASAGNDFGAPLCADMASHPRVLCVAAVGPTGERASYSNTDARGDFVVAPGGGLFGCEDYILTTSTREPGTFDSGCERVEEDDAWYGYNAGTSLAAPYVAGLAALLVEEGLTNAEVVARIKATAVPVPGALAGGPVDPLHGHGLVNAYCAVTNGAGDGCAARSAATL